MPGFWIEWRSVLLHIILMSFSRLRGGKEDLVSHELFLRCVRRRIAGNPQEPLLERFLTYLIQRGYAPATWYRYLRITDHFGRWLGRRLLTFETTQDFLTRHLPRCHCRVHSTRSLQRNGEAIRILREMVGLAPRRSSAPLCFADRLMEEYGRHLTQVRGLAPVTVHHRLDLARRMLRQFRARQSSQFRGWTAAQVHQYIAQLVRPYQTSTGRAMTSATRSFLRYLFQKGLIQRDLAAAVPRLAHWRLGPLPDTLTIREIEQLVRAARQRTSLGLRDRAILLCMVELGLRRPDITGLQLAGVDLAHQVLGLAHHKERETAATPMTSRLAHAIGLYLRKGRPACDSPFLFVSHRAPVGKPLSTSAIGHVVERIARLAKLQDRVAGTHIFRHSLASRMLASGARLKQIADVLGHQSIDTTMIYAKVDLNALTQVALPWPGRIEGKAFAGEVRP